MSSWPSVSLSVVIPVFNEELNLPALFARLYPALDTLGRSYEIIFTNDGSSDRSFALLRAQHAARPDVTRVIDLAANRGQHAAILAAFERVRGEVVVTLDADLQNPPEEIPKLLEKIDAGHDCVGGCRIERRDSVFRTWASRMVNFVRGCATSIRMTDHGCMLRAYRRAVVDAIVRSGASNTFIPALAWRFAAHPAEVAVRHDARHAGESKYSLAKLMRLNADLMATCLGRMPRVPSARIGREVREALDARTDGAAAAVFPGSAGGSPASECGPAAHAPRLALAATVENAARARE